MRTIVSIAIFACPWLLASASQADRPPTEGTRGGAQKDQAADKAEKPTERAASPKTADNPTARSGRGEPSLDDFFRPAAWIHIDGKGGEFVERDGKPRAEWMIAKPVKAAPTFRVEVYEPLLGTPTDFTGIVESLTPGPNGRVAYAIVATEGGFRAGRDYSLLRPGERFVMRNLVTGDVVSHAAPLPAGEYVFAARIGNADTGKQALALTAFTVARDDSSIEPISP